MITNGRHRYMALQTINDMQRPTIKALRALFSFLHYCLYCMALGYYPYLAHYDGDYDEHYYLDWWMPETSKLKLDYYYLHDYRDGRKFVYSPGKHYNNTEYDDIPF